MIRSSDRDVLLRIWTELGAADYESLQQCVHTDLPRGDLVLVVVRTAFESNRTPHAHPSCSLAAFVDRHASVRSLLAVVREALWRAHAQPCGAPAHRPRQPADAHCARCVLRAPTHTWTLYSPATARPLLPADSLLPESAVFPALDLGWTNGFLAAPPVDGSAFGGAGGDTLLDAPIGASPLVACEPRTHAELCAEYARCWHTCRLCDARQREKGAQCQQMLERSPQTVTAYTKLAAHMARIAATARCERSADCFCIVAEALRGSCTSLLRVVAVPSPVDFSHYLLDDDVMAARSVLTRRYFAQLGCDMRHGLRTLGQYRLDERGARAKELARAIPASDGALRMPDVTRTYAAMLDAARTRFGVPDARSFCNIVLVTRAYQDRQPLRDALAWLVPAAAWPLRYAIEAFDEFQELVVGMDQAGQVDESCEREMFSELRWCDNRRLVLARVVSASFRVATRASGHLRDAAQLALLIYALALYETVAREQTEVRAALSALPELPTRVAQRRRARRTRLDAVLPAAPEALALLGAQH